MWRFSHQERASCSPVVGACNRAERLLPRLPTPAPRRESGEGRTPRELKHLARQPLRDGCRRRWAWAHRIPDLQLDWLRIDRHPPRPELHSCPTPFHVTRATPQRINTCPCPRAYGTQQACTQTPEPAATRKSRCIEVRGANGGEGTYCQIMHRLEALVRELQQQA